MGRQRSVQMQVADRSAQVLATARSFIDEPGKFHWLETLLANYGVDADAGILVELRSVPDQGCWVHYGIWLTSAGRFLKFVVDERFGERTLDGSGLLESSRLDDITDETSRAVAVRGVGTSFGSLAIAALRALGKDARPR